jgi:O-antigen/teichoic acid export membrane protein
VFRLIVARIGDRLNGAGTLARYTGSSIVLQVANAACGLVMLRWLEPAPLGLWQSLLLIGSYLQLAQGGAIHGLNRELPFSAGQGDASAISEYAGTGRVVAIASACLCLLAIPAAWVVFKASPERWGTTAVLVGTAAQLYRLYLGATYRAKHAFEMLARIQVAETAVAVGSLGLVFFWGFGGLAVRYLIQMLGGALLNHIFRPIRQVGRFRWARLRALFAVGVPIFAFGYLSDVARTFPRLVLLSFGGVEWVGLFAPAMAVVGALSMIPAAVGTYIYPQMTYKLGRSGDPASLWPVARITVLGALAVGVPMAAVVVVMVPTLITNLAPGYALSIQATQIVALAGAFMGASVIVNALASLKAYKWMFSFVASRLTLLMLLPWAGAKLVGGVTGIATGMAAAYALDFFVVLGLVRVATRPTGS